MEINFSPFFSLLRNSTRLSARIIGRRCRQRQHRLSRRTAKPRKFHVQKCRNRKKGEQVTINNKGNLCDDHIFDVISEDSNITGSGLGLGGGNGVVNKVTLEIISRLPVRSLVRFKCVCKPWQFLVEKDPYFINLHRANSNARPNLFFIVYKPLEKFVRKPGVNYTYEGTSRTAVLVTADFEGGSKNVANIHNIREVDVPFFARFFGPLNGLIGFYDHEYYLGVRIFNICTQATTPWLKSALVRKHEQKGKILAENTNCQLGFDHATKKHKVICIWNITYCNSYHRPNGIFCEVLTIGEHEWRTVVGVPTNVVSEMGHIGCSIYINGSIYYSTLNFMKSGLPDNDKIVVFDVGLEKFRSIAVPSFIIDHSQSQDINNAIYNYVKLLEISGHLALLCRVNDRLVKVWLYGDDTDGDCSEKCWREATIELPFIWDKERRLTFHPVVGQNEIIIKCRQYSVEKPYESHSISYHVYDWRKRTFTKMEINGIPSASRNMFNNAHSDRIFTDSLLHV